MTLALDNARRLICHLKKERKADRKEKNYMVLSNYFYLVIVIVICLNAIIRFKVTDYNNSKETVISHHHHIVLLNADDL